MPNRNIKESICTSETLDTLSANAERLFYRLIVQCDDFGRLEAKPPIVRAKCFPLKLDTITDAEVSTWLAELANAGLINLYINNKKLYLQMVTWAKYQRRRANYSKYPGPDDDNSEQIEAADNCGQLTAHDSKCPQPADNCGQLTGYNEKRETRNEKRETRNEYTVTLSPETKPQKQKYGEFKNILLTEEEYKKLQERFPGGGAEKRIEELSVGIASKGYKYKDHYAAILSWARKDEKESKNAIDKSGSGQFPVRYSTPEEIIAKRNRERNEQLRQ
jgi:hypothetical protein